MTVAIAATNAYRNKVAISAATGASVPYAKWMAFGGGDTAYAATDTVLTSEFLRVEADAAVDGVSMTVTGVLRGIDAGINIVREVGVIASDGTLMGRRVVTPKELEPETEIEFAIVFEY